APDATKTTSRLTARSTAPQPEQPRARDVRAAEHSPPPRSGRRGETPARVLPDPLARVVGAGPRAVSHSDLRVRQSMSTAKRAFEAELVTERPWYFPRLSAYEQREWEEFERKRQLYESGLHDCKTC